MDIGAERVGTISERKDLLSNEKKKLYELGLDLLAPKADSDKQGSHAQKPCACRGKFVVCKEKASR